ncbi:hypothetical protein [Mucilaginibacter endophyticus]|uniref:hypothetical protein n=1 Tax=Mucilaginibacter endophyticus TaxID=2675003 RepID=UPI000E0DE2F2|nr:hypothetical protein [Mucilaginibacter endophyticus]
MGQVTFNTAFSGGRGQLIITSDENNVQLIFDQDDQGPKSLDLHIGHHILGVKGSSPDGATGNIALTITGDIPGEIDTNFPSGDIPPHNIVLFVTAE